MRKKRSYAEIYNDRWDTVVNVFNILRNPSDAAELKKRLELTPYSRSEFLKCDFDMICSQEDPIEKARLTIYRSFSGFGSAAVNSKYSTGFRGSSHRSGTTPAMDWANYPNHIQMFVDRLKGVIVENLDYREVIKRHDTDKTLVYLDPPYIHATRNMQRGNASYEFEFTNQDHVEMYDFIKSKKGMFIVSGYDNSLYNDLFVGWRKEYKDCFADGASPRTEVLWISPNCPK
jgi:DNA adenine methylase